MSSVAAAIVGGLVASAIGGSSYMQYKEQKKARQAQEQAQRDALNRAQREKELQDQAMNKANAKAPSIENADTTATSSSSIMTSVTGVDKSELELGKNQLLGA